MAKRKGTRRPKKIASSRNTSRTKSSRRKHKPTIKRRIKSSARKKKSDLLITSNGRTWIFWDVNNPRDKREIKGAAAKAFAMQFPIERVANLAKKAFKKFKVKQIHLWAASGVVGQPFVDLQAFIDWVDEKWSAGRYVNDKGYSSDPERWINGIAILIKE
jgi:hypothetical protein